MAGTDRQRLLYTALHRFGFGVVIETTNGLIVHTDGQTVDKLHKKSQNAQRAKIHFKKRVSNAIIETGLGCFARGDITITPETDFVLRVNAYEQARFEKVIYQLSAPNRLAGGKKKVIDYLLNLNRRKNAANFFEKGYNPARLAKTLELNGEKIVGLLAELKGLLMEGYTAQLLTDYIQPSFVITRMPFLDREDIPRDADVVIACPQQLFHNALSYANKHENVTIFRRH